MTSLHSQECRWNPTSRLGPEELQDAAVRRGGASVLYRCAASSTRRSSAPGNRPPPAHGRCRGHHPVLQRCAARGWGTRGRRAARRRRGSQPPPAERRSRPGRRERPPAGEVLADSGDALTARPVAVHVRHRRPAALFGRHRGAAAEEVDGVGVTGCSQPAAGGRRPEYARAHAIRMPQRKLLREPPIEIPSRACARASAAASSTATASAARSAMRAARAWPRTSPEVTYVSHRVC